MRKGADFRVKGVLNINKPPGMSSRAVVDRLALLLPRGKIGHAGTLDPLASGVLIVCLGSATRLVEYLQRMAKTYRAVIRLGARSDTLDADGRVEDVENPRIPEECDVRRVLAEQVGEIHQLPPEYSALKVMGKRAYKLARGGRDVALRPRIVRVDRVELVAYHWPHLELEIDCGGGTYIRSIARDVGDELGCGGLIDSLVRTRIGPFGIEDAVDPLNLTPASLQSHLLPLLAAVPDLPVITLRASQVAAVVQGRVLAADDLWLQSVPQGEIALLDHDRRLVAIAQGEGQKRSVHPRKVFH
jgi:tRNA pseudouridine55 synthase